MEKTQRPDYEVNFDRLTGLADQWIPDRAFHDMLCTLAPDYNVRDVKYLGFKRAPAASRNHHAYEGGLVKHYLEMWDLWSNVLLGRLPPSPLLTGERILKAIILHDLHKGYCTFVETPGENEFASYGRDMSESYLTMAGKTLWIMGHHGIVIDEIQMNALEWSEGGFSKTKPRGDSVLAKVAYLLDELSGNVIGRIENEQHYWMSGSSNPNYGAPLSR